MRGVAASAHDSQLSNLAQLAFPSRFVQSRHRMLARTGRFAQDEALAGMASLRPLLAAIAMRAVRAATFWREDLLKEW